MFALRYPKFWQSKNFFAYILLPFGYIYLLLGFIRRVFASSVKLNARVICVGNATIGGTGKTQLVIKLAQEFRKRNINFIILCKGYGGSNKHYSLVTSTSSPIEVGDEALELCQYGTTFAVPKMQYANEIIEKYKPDIVLVDDGMQNPYFEKDFVIMVIDGVRGFGNGFPIPAGPMRSLESDIHADKIVVIGGDYMNDYANDYPKFALGAFNAKIVPAHSLKGRKYYAFAGIGNPQKFFRTLRDAGAQIEGQAEFPDHYLYTKSDIEKLLLEAKKKNLRLITTRKDYVKIRYAFYNSYYNNDVDNSNVGFPKFAAEMVVGPEVPSIKRDLKLEYLEIDLDVDRFEELVRASLGD